MTKPGITSKFSKLPIPSKKWIIGGGIVALAAALGLSECDGGNQQQQQDAASAPVDQSKSYYQIINHATLSGQDSPDKPGYKDNAPTLEAGSCVEGLSSGGKQIEGDRTYRVRATDAEGNATEGYVFLGHIGDRNLDPSIQGFTCKAKFVAATEETPTADAQPKIPTYEATEDLNLRDGSMATEIWGTIAKGSCISFAGSRENGLIQIGHVEKGQNPQDMGYKWVIESKLKEITTPVDQCFATVKQNPAPALDF